MTAHLEDHTRDAPEAQPVAVPLTAPEMAAIVDALLQAERILPLIDGRHAALKSIGHLRCLQLSLADRLEELMASAKQTGSAKQVQQSVAKSAADLAPSNI